MPSIGSLRFRTLLNSDYKALSNELGAHPELIDGYLDNLIADLGVDIGGEPSDAEHVYIVALAHYNNFSIRVLNSILEKLKRRDPSGTIDLFLEAAQPAKTIATVQQGNFVNRRVRPSFTQAAATQLYNRIRLAIKDDSIARITELVAQLKATYDPHIDRTGDAAQYVLNSSRIASDLIRSSKIHGIEGIKLAESLIVSALKWAPFNEYLWNRWAECYIVGDDVETAELLQWEAMRRLPFNTVGASIFAEFMATIAKRVDIAIDILRLALPFSTSNPAPWSQLARRARRVAVSAVRSNPSC